jgi:signal transduction histidine kinase
VPLQVDREAIGALLVGPRRDGAALVREDVALVDTLAPLLATTLKTSSLIERLEQCAPTVGERESALADLSLQLMHAQEGERRRIALDLHDDALQRAILLAREMGETSQQPGVSRWRAVLGEIVDGLRATCADLRPPHLDDLGLVAALEWLIDVVRARADLPARLTAETADGSPFGRLPADLELALFRIAQEALNNCLKHARCTEAAVALRRDDRRLVLSVADDGRGCAPTAKARDAALRLGILGMQARLRPWGGTVTMAPREGGGTVLMADVSMESVYGGGH